jgi:eukaryotic-like serine/threonine-protein kinase
MVGVTISHYEILEKLGQGGMGVVYRARDTRLDRFVAIKVLSPDRSGNSDSKRRFLREAKAVSALNHPGIVTIHDIVTEGDLDLIVMEYVSGRTLDRLIPATGLDLDVAFAYATQMADALASTHSAGVIHRDLKPSNVIVAENGTVKLLDFGLAKLNALSAAASESDTTVSTSFMLTEVGSVVGTPAYMSPEQAAGLPVDSRTDIFSFGSMMYHMLTGARPFDGQHTAAIVHEVFFAEPARLKGKRPGTPDAVEALVLKCLNKKPEDRYQSMGDVAAELRRLVSPSQSGRQWEAGLATITLPPNQAVAGQVTWKQRKPTLRWTVVALITAVGGLAISIPSTRDVVLGKLSTASDAALSKSAFDLTREGREWIDRYYSPGNIGKSFDLFQRALARDPKYAPAYAGAATALWRRFMVDQDRAALDQALSNAQRAVEIDPHLSASRLALGWVLIERGQSKEALSEFKQVLIADPLNADAHRGLGAAYKRLNRREEALASYKKAIELRADDWENHNHLGNMFYQLGDYQNAESEFRRVIELAPDHYAGYRNLGSMFHMQGRYPEAAAQWQKCLQIYPTATIYTNLGTTYFVQGLYQQAVSAMEKGIELGANNSLVWGNLGDAYRWTPGNTSKANDAYLRASQLVREALQKSPEDGDLRSRLAMYLAKRGDIQQAVAEMVAVEKLPKKNVNVLYRSTIAYEIAGKRDEALRSVNAALGSGYSMEEVRRDPELTELRKDVRYHQIVMKLAPTAAK